MSSLTKRELFGGAIVAETSPNLIDASDLRQVPDTQEVFMYPGSSVSIIIEILQRVEPSHFNDAIKFHFDSLANDNEAQAARVESVNVIANDRGDDTPSAIVLSGVQHVPKFNQASADEVRILMALYRVETKGIDLVVTFNVPIISSDGGAVGPDGWQPFQADFDAFVRSLRIVDQGLFA